ncbi:MAG TPA: pyrroline-5-carboxylate reductase [Thermoplasmatales archaeon]|nr:pyrroline-5-carboxylate reductase [Thermoplasmatales archaeon]
MEIPDNLKFAILGGGNIGQAIAKGLVASGRFSPEQIIITRRKVHLLEEFAQQGYITQVDNRDAVRRADIIIIAVLPQQLNNLLHEIKSELIPEKHIVISVVSGVNTSEIIRHIGKNIPVVRIMPTMAIAIQESMTCIASKQATKEAIKLTKSIFDLLGETLVINEEQMIPATALCGCGIAFFLRAIRAASQGGIEIGFHPYEALPMAAQTAKGAAALLLSMKNHPEMEIDKVTTPEGCTISGLNEMEHQGFSSAMIKGIITSAEKAAKLYNSRSEEEK